MTLLQIIIDRSAVLLCINIIRYLFQNDDFWIGLNFWNMLSSCWVVHYLKIVELHVAEPLKHNTTQKSIWFYFVWNAYSVSVFLHWANLNPSYLFVNEANWCGLCQTKNNALTQQHKTLSLWKRCIHKCLWYFRVTVKF